MQVDPGQRDQAHLQDMLDSAKQAASYVRGQTFDQFWDDAKTRDAVAMRLQAIGEAAGRVSPATAAAVPALPIHQMRGLRNRSAHTYSKVDFKEVWKVTQHDRKPLISELEKYFFQQSQRQAEAERLKLSPGIRPPRPWDGPRLGM